MWIFSVKLTQIYSLSTHNFATHKVAIGESHKLFMKGSNKPRICTWHPVHRFVKLLSTSSCYSLGYTNYICYISNRIFIPTAYIIFNSEARQRCYNIVTFDEVYLHFYSDILFEWKCLCNQKNIPNIYTFLFNGHHCQCTWTSSDLSGANVLKT